MAKLSPLKGNQRNKEYLAKAAEKGKLSHSFIISGEKGSGKRTFTENAAAALLCRNNIADRTQPCRSCESCKKVLAGSHPDFIEVRNEKETLISVDEIRSQVVADVGIKPFYGPYKIYIIPDASLLNENGQNALLKTIEEPPEYAVIFLLVENEEMLLPTIRSRCIKLSMERLSGQEIEKETGSRAFAAFADGNLGKAKELAESEEKAGFLKGMEGLLAEINTYDAVKISKEAAKLDKNNAEFALEIMRKWFASMLLIKEGTGKNYFPEKVKELERLSQNLSYEDINTVLEALKSAEEELKANVKAEAVFENIYLLIRNRYGKGSRS